jgi:hypothetical protein
MKTSILKDATTLNPCRKRKGGVGAVASFRQMKEFSRFGELTI